MSATLIDTHAHLDDERFDADRDEVIQRAFEAGLEAIVSVGTDRASWDSTWEICEQHTSIFPVLGYHPNRLNEFGDEDWPRLAGWLKDHRPVALGETGLDYYWDTVAHDRQELYFRAQIRLADEMGLPIVIHCRDAYEDCLRILSEETSGAACGIMHCFAGDAEVAERALDLGLYLSFGGPVTYKKSDALRAAARLAPADRLLVETDCPFLAPQARRGKRNEPAYVHFTAELLAEIREVPFETLAESTTANAHRVLHLTGST